MKLLCINEKSFISRLLFLYTVKSRYNADFENIFDRFRKNNRIPLLFLREREEKILGNIFPIFSYFSKNLAKSN